MKTKKIKPKLIPRSLFAEMRYFTHFNLKKSYGFRIKDKMKLEGPTLIMANHTTDSDLFFVIQHFKNYLFFVYSEHLVRKSSVLRWLTRRFGFIPLTKGGVASDAAINILRYLKAGQCVAIFPEGTRSFDGRTNPIKPATAKLVKMGRCNLVTIGYKGGYFVEPKWAKNWRTGPITSDVKVYTKEELAAMSVDEIYNHIAEDLIFDAQDIQDEKQFVYNGKGLAEGMENVLFMCPKCHKYETIKSEGNRFYCSSCGFEATYDEKGYIHSELPMTKIREYYDAQKKILDETPLEQLNFESENVILDVVKGQKHKTVLATKGTLFVDQYGLRINDYNFKFEDIVNIELVDAGNKMLFSVGDDYYELYSTHLSGLLYSFIFERVKSNYEK